ncbi:molybdopterin molybdotransferase MoeA [Desulfogranum marinum]|uniref:molybdopterin molybdotransferase MoeA n=1 Tax=Desulfogranum marinum TaxID=453220 RepID=UPI0029C95723|nr:molybdopterin molybdotransferase MoeA [Desulfogranum marinum]
MLQPERATYKSELLGFKEAKQLCKTSIIPLPAEKLPLLGAAGRILAHDIFALVDSPSVDGSLKDGYAVLSKDIETASKNKPITLQLAGTLYAGGTESLSMTPGTAIRILTGAEIPEGADSVVAEEFTHQAGEKLTVMNTAEPGRNILFRGTDVRLGEVIGAKGSHITPGILGLAAAAGHNSLSVVRRPKVALIATGDEIVAPGQPLDRGKLYASNITTLAGWCRKYGLDVHLEIVQDTPEAIEKCFTQMHTTCDAMITSGGAWTGDHDLVAKVISHMGGEIIFHRLRIGPGKATGLAMLSGKPVFILPGGPPSNLMGFLQIALPGIMQLGGYSDPPLSCCRVCCSEELRTNFPDWVQFIFGRLQTKADGEPPLFIPLLKKSRLRSMAEADAVISINEGKTAIAEHAIITAQLLR